MDGLDPRPAATSTMIGVATDKQGVIKKHNTTTTTTTVNIVPDTLQTKTRSTTQYVAHKQWSSVHAKHAHSTYYNGCSNNLQPYYVERHGLNGYGGMHMTTDGFCLVHIVLLARQLISYLNSSAPLFVYSPHISLAYGRLCVRKAQNSGAGAG